MLAQHALGRSTMVLTRVNGALGPAGRSASRPADRFARQAPSANPMNAGGPWICVVLLVTSSGQVRGSHRNDFKRVETIKPLFQGLMVDLVETTKTAGYCGSRCRLHQICHRGIDANIR